MDWGEGCHGLRSRGDTYKKAEIRKTFPVGPVPNMNSSPKAGGVRSPWGR